MVRSSTMPSPNPHDKVKNTWKRDWVRNKTVYFVFIPVAIYIIVTHYLPMFGIVMAFQDFSLSKGVFGSTFVGPDNFVELFTATRSSTPSKIRPSWPRSRWCWASSPVSFSR